MNIKQYKLNHNITTDDLAKLCDKSKRTIENAIANNFIIVNGTVYSPRFEIDESKLNEVKK